MGNPRVGGSDHGEELNQSSPDAFAVVSREAPDQLDQPAEGVLHMATADVEVGDEELRVDVVRPLGGCVARLVEVGTSSAGDEANTGETLGDLVVSAQAKGYQLAKNVASTPFNGYLFRILTGQGPAAPDGAYDYIVRNHMIAGFGLVAFPAQYGISGVMTFIANHDGIVYQKDLGATTDTIATAMRRFNPDKTWTKVEVGIP